MRTLLLLELLTLSLAISGGVHVSAELQKTPSSAAEQVPVPQRAADLASHGSEWPRSAHTESGSGAQRRRVLAQRKAPRSGSRKQPTRRPIAKPTHSTSPRRPVADHAKPAARNATAVKPSSRRPQPKPQPSRRPVRPKPVAARKKPLVSSKARPVGKPAKPVASHIPTLAKRPTAISTARPAPRPSAPKPATSSSPSSAAIPPGLNKAAAQTAAGGCGVSACFALDRSDSITAGDWAAMRAFVQTAIGQLTPAPTATSAFLSNSAFAAVSFATDTQPIVSPLTADASAASSQVGAAVQNPPSADVLQQTNLAAAITGCWAALSGAPSVGFIILLTDGNANLPTDADAAKAAQDAANSAREAGYLVVTVGIGAEVDATLLTNLASAGAFQMLTPSEGLDGVALNLLPAGCGPQPPPPPPPSPPPPPPPVTCSGATYAFDDAPGTYVVGYTSLPSDYGGGALNWTNWNVINGTLWGSSTTNGNSSGYAVGVVSPPNVIFNNGAQDASIYAANAGQTLSLCSFYGTPGYSQASPLSFTVFGYQGSTQTASASFTAYISKGPVQFFLPLPDFLGLTSVLFRTVTSNAGSQQQQLVIDNMVIGVD